MIPNLFAALFSSLSYLLEIYESAIDIRVYELNTYSVTNVQALRAADQFSFDGRMQEPDPRPLGRCAGDDGIELLIDP